MATDHSDGSMSGEWLALGAVGVLAVAGAARRRGSANDDDPEFDPADYLRFRTGDCWLMAHVLHQEMGLPVYGLFEPGATKPDHVFVMDEAAGEVFDAEGPRSLAGAFERFRGEHIRALTSAEVADFPSYSEEEWEYARNVAYEQGLIE